MKSQGITKVLTSNSDVDIKVCRKLYFSLDDNGGSADRPFNRLTLLCVHQDELAEHIFMYFIFLKYFSSTFSKLLKWAV